MLNTPFERHDVIQYTAFFSAMTTMIHCVVYVRGGILHLDIPQDRPWTEGLDLAMFVQVFLLLRVRKSGKSMIGLANSRLSVASLFIYSITWDDDDDDVSQVQHDSHYPSDIILPGPCGSDASKHQAHKRIVLTC